MSDLIKDKTIPPTNATVVNQHGKKSVYANTIENLTLTQNIISLNPIEKDDTGKPYVPINRCRYDAKTRTIFLGNEKIILPVQIAPQDEIDSESLPYINALCEVYAEKLNKAVSPENIDSLPAYLKRNYADQRKAYYSADSLGHSIREVFANGDEEFNSLKEDAYDGISSVVYDNNHQSGYDRLLAVLNKITSTTLDRSAITSIVGLIGNLEKIGICHILVNDGEIKSWVNIDE